MVFEAFLKKTGEVGLPESKNASVI